MSAIRRSDELLGRVVAFHPRLSLVTGTSDATVLICQMRYRQSELGEWFPFVREDIERQTGLKRRRQQTARARLVELGWLEERPIAHSSMLEYRVVYEKIEADLLELEAAEGGHKTYQRGAQNVPKGGTKRTNVSILEIKEISSSSNAHAEIALSEHNQREHGAAIAAALEEFPIGAADGMIRRCFGRDAKWISDDLLLLLQREGHARFIAGCVVMMRVKTSSKPTLKLLQGCVENLEIHEGERKKSSDSRRDGQASRQGNGARASYRVPGQS